MSTAETKIQWTDRSWNPAKGCSRVSPGCVNCYAERHAARFSKRHLPFYGFVRRDANDEAQWTGKVSLVAHALREPMSWRKPARIFVNSMSDLFHWQLTNEEIGAVFGIMAACPQHTFQILTKRSERLPEWFDWAARETEGRFTGAALAHNAAATFEKRGDRVTADVLWKAANRAAGRPWPLPNVHLGVSVEDQAHANLRIPHLLRAPAAVRFLSCEPLLGEVDVRRFLGPATQARGMFDGIGWVIAGGESGPGARPCDVYWIRDLVRQCADAGVPCFVKQLGSVAHETRRDVMTIYGNAKPGRVWPGYDGHDFSRVKLSDAKGGMPADWDDELRVRQFPGRRAFSIAETP